VLAGGRDPLIGRIKLAWWRDALEALGGAPPPGEPLLQALTAEVLPRSIAGTELAAMEEGWTLLLSDDPLTQAQLEHYAFARGGLIFRFSARILGGSGGEQVERGGEAWALADLARHIGSKSERDAAFDACRARLGTERWPASLRPLGMLTALAARDADWQAEASEIPGSPRRMLRMMRHRLTGF
jgi:phytoene synthase